MNITYQSKRLTFCFKGELDNLAILRLKEEAVISINSHQASKVCFNFSEVSFIDSTGVGFILARYNQIKAYGGELVVAGCSSSIRRLFALSGIFQIINEEDSKQGVKQ